MEALPKNCSVCVHHITVKRKGGLVGFYCWHPMERAAQGRRIECELMRLDGCPLDKKRSHPHG